MEQESAIPLCSCLDFSTLIPHFLSSHLRNTHLATMKYTKLSFENSQGEKLSARLELPVDTYPHNFALFAHCFTCNKNLLAINNISRALTNKGIGVMRFDFTGLGESEGDFSDTNFSSNIQDLICAADYLKDNYKAPSLLIGHSLGGAAVLVAKHSIASVKAVATIGAPADPAHVTHLLGQNIETIQEEGEADVNIGGRGFKIKKQFLDDLADMENQQLIKKLNAALLIMHSPQDAVVDIENAAQLYKMAHHPKSYLSLDKADHLLSNKNDSLYVGSTIASWAERYLDIPGPADLPGTHQVVVRTNAGSYTSDVRSGAHRLTADEPENLGGNNFGPNPYDFLSIGLGACTSMTLHMYAARKKWDLQEVMVYLEHEKVHKKDCESCDEKPVKIDQIKRVIEISGDLDEAQRKRLLEIADRCPVHRTLHSEVEVLTSLKE